jgi:redox-sensing transcriptional repressor
MTISIPGPTLRRLPKYYRRLKRAIAENTTFLSSADLGASADVPPEQVRKDLSYLSEKGRSGVGYDVKALAGHLEEFLGLVNHKDAILVGAGNLGRALALFPGFQAYGLQIVVLFDNDPAKIGKKVGPLEVLPIGKMVSLVQRMNISLGIITTPPESAQEIAEKMIEAGIHAIWNFSPRRLNLPEDVAVKNEDLASELAVLSHKIERLKVNYHVTESQNA